MNGIEKIIDKIIGEAEDYRRVSIEQASRQIEDIGEKYASETDYAVARLNTQAERDCADIMLRAESSAAINKRNTLLASRGELLNAAFDGAAAHIRSMPSGDYIKLLSGLLAPALRAQLETEREARELYGEETEGAGADFEIILNKKDFAAGADIIREAASIPSSIPADVFNSIKISDSPASIDGGFILRRGGVEINCSVSLMLARLRDELEGEVYRALFD